MVKKPTKRRTKGQLISSRLPFLRLPETKYKRQAHHSRFWFSHRTAIDITSRNFSTPSVYHHKKGRKVITLGLGRVKEISFDIRKYKRPHKNSFAIPSAQGATASIIIVCLGIGGVFFFGSRVISTPQELYIPNNVVVPDFELENLVAESSRTIMSESVPTRIRIDKIGVDADIITVGKLADNTMETPPYDNITGWYEFGPTPGELGPAIINGHVGTTYGPGVFWDLRNLVPGDIISINREDGTIASFSVIKVDQYGINNFPTNEVYGNIDHAGLRLITCGGEFNSQSLRYSHNTVVYASLVE